MSTIDDGEPLLPAETSLEENAERQTMHKLNKRILYLTVSVALIAYVDRSNIGFAAKTLCNDLAMDHEQYGLGITLFYAGYVLTQIISSMALKRVSPPTWLSFLMFSWGCFAAAMAFIRTKTQFYALRFLLGVAEGGTFPGIYYYLAMFYPNKYLSGAYSVLLAAKVVSMPIASPIAAGLLSLEGVIGVDGWRILFFVEGVAPIFYAVLLYSLLPKKPQQASFLEDDEKKWIIEQNSVNDAPVDRSVWTEISMIIKVRGWWLISLSCLSSFAISNCLMFWVTLLVDDMLYGNSDDEDGPKTCGSKHGSKVVAVLLTSIPYIVSSVGCIMTRWLLDNERIQNRVHFAITVKVATGVLLLAWVGLRGLSFVAAFLALVGAIGCFDAVGGPLMALIVDHVDRTLTRTATALYNNLVSVGPLLFPTIIGKILDDFNYGIAVVFCSLCIFVCSLLLVFVTDPHVQKKRNDVVFI